MKQNIVLTEGDLRKIVNEALAEINGRRPGALAQFGGYSPGFDATNPRHMKAFDVIMDSIRYTMYNFKIRPDVIRSMLSSIEEDFSNGQY